MSVSRPKNSFNSMKVRLKLITTFSGYDSQLSFNSMKVRLKQENRP